VQGYALIISRFEEIKSLFFSGNATVKKYVWLRPVDPCQFLFFYFLFFSTLEFDSIAFLVLSRLRFDWEMI